MRDRYIKCFLLVFKIINLTKHVMYFQLWYKNLFFKTNDYRVVKKYKGKMYRIPEHY